MNTLVLLVAIESNWSPEQWASSQGGVRNANGLIAIERNDEWVTVVRDNSILNDFDERERRQVSEMVGEAVPYVIEWRGDVLLGELLRSALPETRAVIDNDHGLIVSIQQVANRTIDSWIRSAKL
jgi:hypothetical protein